jgi:hypothetical protein
LYDDYCNVVNYHTPPPFIPSPANVRSPYHHCPRREQHSAPKPPLPPKQECGSVNTYPCRNVRIEQCPITPPTAPQLPSRCTRPPTYTQLPYFSLHQNSNSASHGHSFNINNCYRPPTPMIPYAPPVVAPFSHCKPTVQNGRIITSYHPHNGFM